MCFVLALFMVCSFRSSWQSHTKLIRFFKLPMRIKRKTSQITLVSLCHRISAGLQPVTHWGWLTLGPCATRRGAALSLKMMACPRLSPLHTNSVRNLSLYLWKLWVTYSSAGIEHLHYAFYMYANAYLASEWDMFRAIYNLSFKYQRNAAGKLWQMFASIIRVETGLAGGLCNFPEDLYGCGFQPWSQSTAGVQSQQLFQCIHLMFCSQISPSLEDSIKTSRSLGRERDPCSTLQLHNAGSCKWQVRYDKLTSQKFSCHELSHENIVLQSS